MPKRDSVIHVHFTVLLSELKTLGVSLTDAQRLNLRSRLYAERVRGRLSCISSGKGKINSIAQRDKVDAVKFAEVIFSICVQHNIVNASHVIRGDKKWGSIERAAMNCDLFLDSFSSCNVSMYDYCKSLITLLGRNYAVYKLPMRHDDVMDEWAKKYYLKQDTSPEKTSAALEALKSVYVQYTGSDKMLKGDKGRLAALHVREDAEKANVSVRDYVVAQFESLSFIDSAPLLSQLYGEKAESRYYSNMKRLEDTDVSMSVKDREMQKLLNGIAL